MMKLAVKLIDGGTEENAVLNIKDNSFVIKTDAGELIKILYTNIEDYKYTENNELIFHLLKSNDIVIKCKLNEELRAKLDEIVSQPMAQEHDKSISVKNTEKTATAKRYNGVVFLPRGQANCDITLKNENITIESGSEILIIPYNSIIRLELTDNEDIKICSNNNNNFVIRCEDGDVLYKELKKSKSNSTYESSSNIKVQDVFGNDILKANNNKNIIKLVLGVAVIVVPIMMFISWINKGNSPADTIAWDVRQMDNVLGYGTRYVIGDLIGVTCNEEEDDGQGRYIVKCNVQYYPKRNNGAIATDSKMNDTIYAVFLRESDKVFYRKYNSAMNDTFKQKSCWGEDKSKGLFCK